MGCIEKQSVGLPKSIKEHGAVSIFPPVKMTAISARQFLMLIIKQMCLLLLLLFLHQFTVTMTLKHMKPDGGSSLTIQGIIWVYSLKPGRLGFAVHCVCSVFSVQSGIHELQYIHTFVLCLVSFNSVFTNWMIAKWTIRNQLKQEQNSKSKRRTCSALFWPNGASVLHTHKDSLTILWHQQLNITTFVAVNCYNTTFAESNSNM